MASAYLSPDTLREAVQRLGASDAQPTIADQPEDEPPRATPQPPRGSPSWWERKRRLMAYGNAVLPQCGYAVGCVVAAIVRERVSVDG